MQLSKKSVIKFAAENPELVVDGVLKYTVTSGKVKSQHQVRVKAEDVESYEAQATARELQEIDEILAVGDEYLKDAEGLRKRREKLEKK